MAGAKTGQGKGERYTVYPMSGERMRAMVRDLVDSHMGRKGYLWWLEWRQRGGIDAVERQRECERKQLAEQLAQGSGGSGSILE